MARWRSRPADDQGILRGAADEKSRFVILNEVKDPSGNNWPAMRRSQMPQIDLATEATEHKTEFTEKDLGAGLGKAGPGSSIPATGQDRSNAPGIFTPEATDGAAQVR